MVLEDIGAASLVSSPKQFFLFLKNPIKLSKTETNVVAMQKLIVYFCLGIARWRLFELHQIVIYPRYTIYKITV